MHGLLDPMTSLARKLMISKLFERPLVAIQKLSDKIPNASKTGIPKMIVYSAHDFQIANALSQIDSTKNYTVVQYASTIFFELWKPRYSEEYRVRTIYNGKTLKFKECADIEATEDYSDDIPEYCPIDKFLKRMNKDLIVSGASDLELKTQCDKPYTPE